MTYIVQRKDRFYVVAYDGTDPATGRERRRWYPAGHSRADAEAIVALLGSMPLRSVRSEHLDRLYGDLLATGGVRQAGLAPKTVYEVHVVIRSAFTQAERQHLVAVNPALAAQPPRSRLRQRSGPECWTAD